MIHVDESDPEEVPESQFCHRKVTVKRSRDVRNTFDIMDEIGRGKFGRVMKCRQKKANNFPTESCGFFAAKFVVCTRREDRRSVEREVDIMNSLKSPLLLQLFDAYDNGKNEMCLITEYIGGGELFDRVIEDEFVLTEKACVVFMRQIVEGVAYIHRQQIMHLDLKPENILCLTKSGNRIKIIDFGLARKHELMKTTQVLFGTPEFVAPEVVSFEPIAYATDMWAVGIICYVLLSGLSPFMGDTDLETMANVTIAEYDYEDEAFCNISQSAKEFMDNLLIKEKSQRWSAEKCLKSEWLSRKNTKCITAPSPVRKDSVCATKANLCQQLDDYPPQDYLFDAPSRTMSFACPSPGPILNHKVMQGLEADSGSDSPKNANDKPRSLDVGSPDTSPEVEASDCSFQYRLNFKLLEAIENFNENSKNRQSRCSTPGLITLDQVQQKAKEICDRKYSHSSGRLSTDQEYELNINLSSVRNQRKSFDEGRRRRSSCYRHKPVQDLNISRPTSELSNSASESGAITSESKNQLDSNRKILNNSPSSSVFSSPSTSSSLSLMVSSNKSTFMDDHPSIDKKSCAPLCQIHTMSESTTMTYPESDSFCSAEATNKNFPLTSDESNSSVPTIIVNDVNGSMREHFFSSHIPNNNISTLASEHLSRHAVASLSKEQESSKRLVEKEMSHSRSARGKPSKADINLSRFEQLNPTKLNTDIISIENLSRPLSLDTIKRRSKFLHKSHSTSYISDMLLNSHSNIISMNDKNFSTQDVPSSHYKIVHSPVQSNQAKQDNISTDFHSFSICQPNDHLSSMLDKRLDINHPNVTLSKHDSHQNIKNQSLEMYLSPLLEELNQQVDFSLNVIKDSLSEKSNNDNCDKCGRNFSSLNNYSKIILDLSNMKREISRIKESISLTRISVQDDLYPLFAMLEDQEKSSSPLQPPVRITDVTENLSHPKNQEMCQNLDTNSDQMKLNKTSQTDESFKRQIQSPKTNKKYPAIKSKSNVFTTARTGSVKCAMNLFESTNHPKSSSQFSTTNPSHRRRKRLQPDLERRRRPPTPVVVYTGNVNKFRNKFEHGDTEATTTTYLRRCSSSDEPTSNFKLRSRRTTLCPSLSAPPQNICHESINAFQSENSNEYFKNVLASDHTSSDQLASLLVKRIT